MSLALVRAITPTDRIRRRLAEAAALIFDVDGTLAETEELHREAFNEAFVQLGLDWHWGRRIYKELLRVTGGKERIRAFDQRRRSGPPLTDAAIARLHHVKTERFAVLMAEKGCPLRPGVRSLLDAALARGQTLAIATTTTRGNIDALLAPALGPAWEAKFAAVVAADDVARKKPAPDAYLEVLSQLDLSGSSCVAIEDSRNGLIAATRAGIPALITRSRYFGDDAFDGALAVVDDLTELAP
ncbi:putative haloacid dehalogenase-like hydrolase, cbbY/cbbZ/gph/yieH family; CbbY-like [Bradyrhizobium sp. STM 3843]|uniref:HAD-IA family hydrolase n=1 Tax=Bradyrhizobium sp. STM 3843 TaxID=551947 RepID=UPI00024053AC|nr:HAD-IA family hydrolase [Bradyrhizobium sp. STM 3843]CCE11197.1 putative haloacid dehalogenase-like hydrolase, cbbY/cbbZ/gph/yieH family; CbbY-like [Bradyrhizobium sp. STM 3843]